MSELATEVFRSVEARSRVAAIAIGRDEGPLLVECLDSCHAQCGSVVYVDSGSSDDSVAHAEALGTHVVEIGVIDPFLPGLARNRGFARTEQVNPEAEFLQFVDADCTLEPGWVERAVEVMDADPEISVVFGWLTERDASASPWKRMCQIEWSGPSGPVDWSGGIFLVRRDLFRQFRGFREDMVVGEEPELCTRIRDGGGRIERLAVPMARHESDMRRFTQWLRREYRGGFMDFGVRTPRGSQPFARERLQTYGWTLGWLGLCILLAFLGSAVAGERGVWLGALAGAAVIPLQMARQVRWSRSQGHDLASSLAYGVLVVLLNWPKLLGQLGYQWHRLTHPVSPSTRLRTLS